MAVEFIPLDVFKRVMKVWWLVALAGILGGIIGFAFNRMHPPLFESQAIYQASLDFTQAGKLLKPNNLTLSQYDEDLALEAVHSALLEVELAAVTRANKEGISLTAETFNANAVVERQHAFWMVRYRDVNPQTAQKVVSIWTDEATKAMRTYQQDGRMKPYVFFELVSPASLPIQPLYNRTNQVVLAGGVAGLIIGLLLTNLPIKAKGKV